jgi:predicted small secreted protein
MRMIKRVICVSFLAMLTACNTVAGFGEDITASADWTKQKMGGSGKPTEDQKNSSGQGDASTSGKSSVEARLVAP